MTTRPYFLICIHILFSVVMANAQHNTEWPCYGNDPGGSRYSPLDQVNINNVKQLHITWTFQTGELETYAGTEAKSKAAFETTPVMIGQTLYFSTPSDRVFAVDALSGKKIASSISADMDKAKNRPTCQLQRLRAARPKDRKPSTARTAICLKSNSVSGE